MQLCEQTEGEGKLTVAADVGKDVGVVNAEKASGAGPATGVGANGQGQQQQ